MAKRAHWTVFAKQECKILQGLNEQWGGKSSTGSRKSNLDLGYPSLSFLNFCGKDGLPKDPERPPEKASQSGCHAAIDTEDREEEIQDKSSSSFLSQLFPLVQVCLLQPFLK